MVDRDHADEGLDRGRADAGAAIDPPAARRLMVGLLNQHERHVPKVIHSGGSTRTPRRRGFAVPGYAFVAFVAAFVLLIVIVAITPSTPEGESMSTGVAVLILLAFLLLIASPLISGIAGWRGSARGAPVSSRKLDRPSLLAGTASIEDIRVATDVVLDELRAQAHSQPK